MIENFALIIQPEYQLLWICQYNLPVRQTRKVLPRFRISAIIAEEAFDCLDAPIVRVAAPDVPAIPFSPPLEKFYMPSVEKIVTALERTLEY